jgi:hypothetical protein
LGTASLASDVDATDGSPPHRRGRPLEADGGPASVSFRHRRPAHRTESRNTASPSTRDRAGGAQGGDGEHPGIDARLPHECVWPQGRSLARLREAFREYASVDVLVVSGSTQTIMRPPRSFGIEETPWRSPGEALEKR